MKALRKVFFRNTTYFLPIMSRTRSLTFRWYVFFSNIGSVQGVVCSLVSQLRNVVAVEICTRNTLNKMTTIDDVINWVT